eukprot:1498391-Amphidinium_carterae.1
MLDIQFKVFKRIKGVVARQLMSKPPTQQSDPLTASQVMRLERLMCELEPSPKKAVLGYLLFVLHVRCHFSDAQMLRAEPSIDK